MLTKRKSILIDITVSYTKYKECKKNVLLYTNRYHYYKNLEVGYRQDCDGTPPFDITRYRRSYYGLLRESLDECGLLKNYIKRLNRALNSVDREAKLS
jgi:hypothetical protein